MSDHRSPGEIERDIETEREEISATVSELQSRLSPEAIIREISRSVSEHGGDMARAVSMSAKQNPVALAVTGVGLAWLMFGRSYDEHDAHAHADLYDSTGRRRYDRPSGIAGRPGAVPAARPYATYGRQAEATPRHGSSHWSHADRDWDGSHDDESDDSDSTGPKLGESASHAVRSLSDRASSMGRRVQSSAAGASQSARDTGTRAASGMRRISQRLSEGTEELSESARDRVITARARFIQARQQAERSARYNARRGADAATEFFEEQPLLAGALALAAGAAIAGLLPRTRMEDEYLGEASDHLYDEAEHIFAEELAKTERVAKAAVDEAATIVEEKRDAADAKAPGDKSAVEAAADEAKSAGQRIKDRTEAEARKENLGKPGS